MAIQMVCKAAACFSVVDFLSFINVAKYHNSSHYKLKLSYTIG
jgi:hypothetical protein